MLFMPLSDAHLTTLHNYFLARQAKVIELTRSLVETESPSGDEEGSRAAVSVLVAAAQAIRGLRVERLPAPNYGEHLRITAFEDASEANPIVILGHTDTVHPRGSLAQRPWRIADGKAYGPGVFDMKGSCVLALEVIRALGELQLQPKHPLILLLTCDEETGSHNGRALVEAVAKALEYSPSTHMAARRMLAWNPRRAPAQCLNWQGKPSGSTHLMIREQVFALRLAFFKAAQFQTWCRRMRRFKST